MNWQWNDAPVSKAYECKHCGRTVYVLGQYLPIHREKGSRRRCKGSESPIRNHRKLSKQK